MKLANAIVIKLAFTFEPESCDKVIISNDKELQIN